MREKERIVEARKAARGPKADTAEEDAANKTPIMVVAVFIVMMIPFSWWWCDDAVGWIFLGVDTHKIVRCGGVLAVEPLRHVIGLFAHLCRARLKLT